MGSAAVAVVVMAWVGRHVNPRGRCVIAFFHDHRGLPDDHRLLLNGGSGTADAGVLHRGDHRFADTLLVERNNVRNLQSPLNASLLNVVHDHRVGQPAAAHVDHICGRHGGLDLSVLLLLVLVILLLILVLLPNSRLIAVFSVAERTAGDSPQQAADHRSSTRFVIIFADDPTSDGPRDSAERRTTLGVGLRPSLRTKHSSQNKANAARPLGDDHCSDFQKLGNFEIGKV